MANGRPMRHIHLVPIMWNDRDPLARFPRSKPYNGDAGGTSRPNRDSFADEPAPPRFARNIDGRLGCSSGSRTPGEPHVKTAASHRGPWTRGPRAEYPPDKRYDLRMSSTNIVVTDKIEPPEQKIEPPVQGGTMIVRILRTGLDSQVERNDRVAVEAPLEYLLHHPALGLEPVSFGTT